MSTAFDDFTAYSAGAVGTVASPNWSVQAAPGGDWTQNIVDDSGDKIVRITRTSSGAATGMIVNDLIGGTTGDIEIFAKYRIDTTTVQTAFCGPVLAASDNQAYGLVMTDASNVRLYRFASNGAQGTSIAAAFAFAMPDGSYVYIRLGRTDSAGASTIRAKIWTGLVSDEPGSWMTSGNNTTLTTLKAAIASRATQQVPIDVTDYGIGTGAGISAPTSAGGGGGGSGVPRFMNFYAQQRRRAL